jgi:hypothetical protein
MNIEAEDPDIRQRLTAVVSCLIDYKATLINKNTINITTPADLINNTMPLLKERCGTIKDFIIRRDRPQMNDSDLNVCLDCLEKALSPWDMDLSILCPEFCDKIFQGFNLNPDKIQIIKEIDLYCPRIDGVPDQEDFQE